jgi:hypothetical protein
MTHRQHSVTFYNFCIEIIQMQRINVQDDIGTLNTELQYE